VRFNEEWWRQAHGSSWVELYAASVNASTRRWLREAITSVAPFTTAVDLGCNCGVLMPMLTDASPDCRVVGIDVSVEALREAKRKYPEHTWVLASVTDWLPVLAKIGSHADIVVSSSCLEHVSFADIDETLQAMATLATRAIILQEVTVTPKLPEGASVMCGVPEWRHDFETRLGKLGWTRTQKYWQDTTTPRPGAVMVFKPGVK
jgi:2-polyprenyl-3-methyl-5-hydroxy-6-metoxy-1,4-benzoquinol methylase